jgi:hypothetical protein
MRLRRYALALGAVLMFAGAALADPVRFFSVIQDVPLMPGLSEVGDQGVVFDKPGGRVAEVLADTGGQSAEAVRAYYTEALPQFGWKAGRGGRFEREEEALELSFEQQGGRSFVRLSLSPR